jgi:hypothetical protein
MAGTYAIYYPPTTTHPYLVVTFLGDRILQATPFESEDDAEASLSGSLHRRCCPAESPRVAGRIRSRGLRSGD